MFIGILIGISFVTDSLRDDTGIMASGLVRGLGLAEGRTPPSGRYFLPVLRQFDILTGGLLTR